MKAVRLCVSPRTRTKALRALSLLRFNAPPRPRDPSAPRTLAPAATVSVNAQRHRVTIVYSGHVQGVGFRLTAREVAAGFDVCGTVRNVPGGDVELIAEGSRHEIDAFRQAIRESGLGPLIREERATESQARGDLKGFQILR